MAKDRTNMVSLLDIGSLNGGTTASIKELGDGFTELQEDWGPDVESTQYVNMKNKASTVKGYEFSMDAEREYISDDVQTVIDELFKDLPTGTQCETDYYRFYKTDAVSGSDNTFKAIKVPVIVCPSTTGGAGGDILKSAIQIKGNGDVVKGTIAIGSGGTYTFTATP
jgi:hypothetical protein